MGRSWHYLAVVGLFALAGCGPAEEPAAEAVQGGEGVTVESAPATEGAPAVDGAPPPGAELPPELDVIPSNE